MLNKNINYKLVDTAGQITAVVFDVLKRNKYASISNYLMNMDSKIEQVVYIEKNRVQTMGNELCINGSLAGAYLLGKPIIEISGIEQSVKFIAKMRTISVQLPLSLFQTKNKNIIKLTGIVYIISNNKRLANKTYLNKLADKYSVPASGIIFNKENCIQPLVYVKETDSLVWENACGSGSLSYFIYSGINRIAQPSNKIIEIKKTEKYFFIRVPVKIVN